MKFILLNKKYLIISSVIVTIIGILLGNSYAKYITSISSNSDISIARWQVLVNNQDITSSSTLTNIITPVFPGNNNIASGVIAPTAEGYFDVVIDATNTDVSLGYEITTTASTSSIVTDLVLSGYSIDNGPRQNVVEDANGDFKITGNILYNSQDKDISLRVYLKWNDDPETGATMNNSADTATTQAQESVAKVSVNLKFTQLPFGGSSGTTSGTSGTTSGTSGTTSGTSGTTNGN